MVHQHHRPEHSIPPQWQAGIGGDWMHGGSLSQETQLGVSVSDTPRIRQVPTWKGAFVRTWSKEIPRNRLLDADGLLHTHTSVVIARLSVALAEHRCTMVSRRIVLDRFSLTDASGYPP